MQRVTQHLAAVISLVASMAAQRATDAGWRRDAASAALFTPAVEDAAARGLGWLAAEQTASGFWTGKVGYRRREHYLATPWGSVEEQLRDETGHLGVTALCGMAFLAGGHTPGRGRYGPNVHGAVEAVLTCVRENGFITTAESRMYSHAFATLFLAEVYGMSVDRRVREALDRSTNIIVDTQNAQGGWRYNPFTRAADLSVTVCQLQALRAARNIGIKVPKATIDRAVEYVRRSQVRDGPDRGRYYYDLDARWRIPKTDHYSVQAAAVTSLLSAGIYHRELIDPVLDFLTTEMPVIARHYPHHYYYWYGNYYASQVFFHADGSLREGCFAYYYAATRDHLLAGQESDGRWLNPESAGPGDAFATAVACIILQIPQQYLPIFQR